MNSFSFQTSFELELKVLFNVYDMSVATLNSAELKVTAFACSRRHFPSPRIYIFFEIQILFNSKASLLRPRPGSQQPPLQSMSG
jgi:hypothetical protein